MSYKLKYSGFSLTEVLIAVGVLAVGMVFVAGVFPVGIYLTTVATERTIAAVAADEAFAKVRIYGVNLISIPPAQCVDFNGVSTVAIAPDEFEYPSVKTSEPNQYCWAALCRRTGPAEVQVTVFVSRKVNPNLKYPNPSGTDFDRPMPIKVGVNATDGDDELTINNAADSIYINDGYTIVDDATGGIYRVIERYKAPNDSTILLDMNWQSGTRLGDVWVVPPPVKGGRGPCITVYQKLIEF